MIILPAIDIKGGQCVRLTMGDYGTAEKVAENAVDTAKKFKGAGAEWLHMVDLDGAVTGKPENAEIFIDVAKNCNMNVELGGGIRDINTVEYYLKNGIKRVILGSAALRDPEFTRIAIKEFGEAIVIGIDARHEKVSVSGWLEDSDVNYIEFAQQMEEAGAKNIIFTDISKDGTMSGPNIDQLRKLNDAISCNVIASGGIRNLDDINELMDMGLSGAICGKSVYLGTLPVDEAVRLAGAQV